MNFKINNPNFSTSLSASILPANTQILTGNLNLASIMAGSPAVGIGAGSIDGIASGAINITAGTPVTIDLTNLAASGLDLYQNAASATFLVAMAIQIAAIGATDVATETLTIGGGANPILVANRSIICLGESDAFQKIQSGGLAISGGAKNILMTASLGVMTANIVLWLRSL